MTRNDIINVIGEYISLPDTEEDIDFVRAGLNSIQIMTLAGKFRRNGYNVSFTKLISSPTLSAWEKLLSDTNMRKKKKNPVRETTTDHSPFALTDIQYAYWVGRNEGQYLGGNDCHLYIETECSNISIPRLEAAFNEVKAAHGMLHAVFNSNGTQKILESFEKKHIRINDLRDKSDEAKAAECEKIRERLSHNVLDIEHGDVMGLEVTIISDELYHLHFDFSLIVADVESIRIILRDIEKAYNHPDTLEKRDPLEFKKYLEAKNNEKYDTEKFREYWENRLASHKFTPDLPLSSSYDKNSRPVFKRKETWIDADKWERICSIGRDRDFTPAMILMTVYGYVLNKWSNNDKFVINMPLFDRNTEYLSNINRAVADFSNLILVGVDHSEKLTFSEQVRRNQDGFRRDTEYSAYSGVKVLRDAAKKAKSGIVYAPVVFACNTGDELFSQEFTETFGKDVYMLSQTPQIWIDFQCFDKDGGMHLIWDHVPAIFPDGMIDDMFYSLEQLFLWLSEDEKNWDSVPELKTLYHIPELKYVPDAEVEASEYGLISGLIKNAKNTPDNIALIDAASGKKVTYGELLSNVKSASAYLREKGIGEGECVAVCMERGIKQITAILSILAAGGAYVPVSKKHPENRRNYILDTASIRYMISSRESGINVRDNTELFCIEDMICHKESEISKINGENTAYIIFTSGSTGVPKGVEISHKAALNTIYDVNRKYEICSSDRAIGVSATDFDLSVYDIFGMLSAGGSLVVISDDIDRNAERWAELVNEYNVTVWNSVPVLCDMLMIAADMMNITVPSLRIVLLSGDWIGLDLRGKLKAKSENARMISLGGATEASIWSNYFEVEENIPSEWKSIPYGYALNNQAYRIVNEKGTDCPAYTEGELLIGGAGVAKGYIGNKELTEKQFITENGVRWYKTGDMGRFWKDGIIEFLGRRDSQVKVRGHRIELGEIETVLNDHPDIEKAVVVTKKDKENTNHLAAFIVPRTIDKELPALKSFGIADSDAENKAYTTYKLQLESSAEYYIEKLFENMDIIHENEKLSEEGIIARSGALPKFAGLVKKWANVLVESGYLNCENGRYSLTGKKHEEVPNDILKAYADKSIGVVRGNIISTELLTCKDMISPEKILSGFPAVSRTRETVAEDIAKLSQGKKKSILFVDPRDTSFVRKFSESDADITIADSSKYFIEKYKEELSDLSNIRYLQRGQEETGDFDYIILDNVLHKYAAYSEIISEAYDSLNDNGILIVLERNGDMKMQLITASLLNDGNEELRLRNGDEWKNIIEKLGFTGFASYNTESICEYSVNFYAKKTAVNVTKEGLQEHLRKSVPEYMIPNLFKIVRNIPISANGKVDRKALAAMLDKLDVVNEISSVEPLVTATEKQLAEIWKRTLKVDTVGRNSNYFVLGGDSLLAMHIITEAKEQLHKKIGIETVFNNPILKDQAAEIDKAKSVNEASKAFAKGDPDNKYRPFPLTDIQQSYWLGRTGAFSLGDISNHCYFELDCEKLDIEKAERTWNDLISRHSMMRAVILPDGQRQKVLKKVPIYKLGVFSAQELGKKDDELLTEMRDSMSHYRFDSKNWPAFHVCISRYTDMDKVHINFDNIIYDGFSMFHILKEWKALYDGRTIEAEPEDFSFRDYVIETEKRKLSAEYEESLGYWRERVKELPQAPQLALKCDPSALTEQKYRRLEFRLDKTDWEKLRGNANENGVTPTTVMLAAFSEILGKWSRSYHFTLNLTLFRKEHIHKDVEKIIGDFTSLILVEADLRKKKSFVQNCLNIQQTLMKELKHSNVSGVEVEREYNKYHQSSKEIAMPVVFTSGIGMDNEDSEQNVYLGRINYGISQTPQVWLDHQIREEDGELVASWDILEDIFYPDMINDMFRCYSTLVEKLAEDADIWKSSDMNDIISIDTSARKKANDTAEDIQFGTLYDLFIDSRNKYGDSPAIITSDKQFTYDTVYEYAGKIAHRLADIGVKKDELVAIVMDKGYEQVISTLGIIMSGAAYLPIDAKFPKERIKEILEEGNVGTLLVQPHRTAKVEGFEGNKIVIDDSIGGWNDDIYTKSPDEHSLAYVIFTSGTTGKPKGVMIEHGAAYNTIVDVNARFGISHSDRAIAISNLNFDLSVYDIYGMWAAGGAIVIPDDERSKDPQHWMELIQKNNITVWNTVPALMEMMQEYLEMKNSKAITLKNVLMSGDWIPVDLPDKLRKSVPNAKIISLGGATEASIWSNYFIIEKVDSSWKSIPYGYPLTNQQFYILNERLEPSPDHVTGDLYIAGKGLARGYYNNKKITDEKFIIHPETGLRLYKTGDLGSYYNDGCMKFLGRDDNQIKLNGYRIELEDIEHTAMRLDGVNRAVAHIVDNKIYMDVLLEKNESNEFLEIQKENTALRADDIGSRLAGMSCSYENFEENIVYCRELDNAACTVMKAVLEKLFNEKKAEYTGSEADVEKLGLDEVYSKLIRQWIKTVNSHTFTEIPSSGIIREFYDDMMSEIDTQLGLITGKINVYELISEDKSRILPAYIGKFQKNDSAYTDAVRNCIAAYSEKKKISAAMEIAGRVNDNTSKYLAALGNNGSYILTDASSSFLENKERAIGQSENISCKRLDINKNFASQDVAPHSVDMIIADNSIHRSDDLDITLEQIRNTLVPSGMLIINEIVENYALQLLTTYHFEKAYTGLKDMRKESGNALLSLDEWLELLEKHGFKADTVFPKENVAANQRCIIARAPETVYNFDSERMTAKLTHMLPKYMMPSEIRSVDVIPLSANGKVDRKALRTAWEERKVSSPDIAEREATEDEKRIINIWKDVLKNENVSVNDDFFNCGGDSLKAMKVIHAINSEFASEITLPELFDNPTVEKLTEIVKLNIQEKVGTEYVEGTI